MCIYEWYETTHVFEEKYPLAPVVDLLGTAPIEYNMIFK